MNPFDTIAFVTITFVTNSRCILKHYDEVAQEARPRILGLTASLLNAKAQPAEMCH
jgi:hypothetical protein